jgi:hypothetical protein
MIECNKINNHERETMNQIHYSALFLRKLRGGKRALWNCWFPDSGFSNIVGAGNTADNAIKDWRKQYKLSMQLDNPQS